MTDLFRCMECDCDVDESQVRTYVEPYGEVFSGCPYCRGVLEPMVKCDSCGEYEVEQYMEYTEDGENLCPFCANKKREERGEDDGEN